jgi:hypothetical protein
VIGKVLRFTQEGSMVWLRRLRTTLFGSAAERGIDEELRFHLDERTEEYVRAGMSLVTEVSDSALQSDQTSGVT